ncbi:class I SAM-dependent methyltransferase [Zoogloea sp.]|uniref:class I SAM-dependent methyltransferase n=1 Tax=Zoogloea sp. TaxID=49181 RepID=UPI0035B21806
MSLTFTGERFLPSCEGEMLYEHWHRYLFARQYVAGKRVLDVASGEGYGSALMAAQAASVTGVDISPEVVKHAGERYGSAANLKYLCASCASIPLPDASFDVIVSFETIEHMTEHDAFMGEVSRLLAPGGLFIISSPNRVEYSDRTGYRNEFHVKELDGPELRSLLNRHFPAQHWFAQRPCFQSMLWSLEGPAVENRVLAIDGDDAYPAELYFLVACAKEAAVLDQVLPSLSLVTDRHHSVYAEWSRTYAENRQLGARVAELEQRLATVPEPRELSAAEHLKGFLRRLLRG